MKRPLQRISLCWLACLFVSCTAGPDFVRPQPPSKDSFISPQADLDTLQQGEEKQLLDKTYKLPENWWETFHSPMLNNLMMEALRENFTIVAANQHLRQSQSLLSAGYGVFLPQVNAGAAASREKSSSSSLGLPTASSIFNIFSLSAGVSYALDFAGGYRRQLESLRAQVDAAQELASATYLTITSQLLNTAIAHAAYEAQLSSAHQAILLISEMIEILQTQWHSGITTHYQVLAAQTQLAQAQITASDLLQKKLQSEHLLASLTGKAPSEMKLKFPPLDELHLPEKIPECIPSDWVRRRPDILLAEALLHVSSAEVGQASAALFPSVNLNASYGLTANSSGRVFQGESRFWNLGANLTAPLFHGGELRALKQAAIESFKASEANYQKTVLDAFVQVADSLRAIENDAILVQAQKLALDSTHETFKLDEVNETTGIATRLQVISARLLELQAEENSIQAAAQRLQDTVLLFAAMGGGQPKGESKSTGSEHR